MDQSPEVNILVVDPKGNPRTVLVKTWEDGLAKEFLEQARKSEDPEVLYNQIMQAVKTGCAKTALPFGEELASYDLDKLRSTITLGILYSETEQEDKALGLYLNYKSEYGDNPFILTNCAKLFKKRGDIDASRELLWESLQLDPNQETAISWYSGTISESGLHYNHYLLDRIKRLKNAWLVYIYMAKSNYEQAKAEDAKKVIEELFQSDIFKDNGPAIFRRLTLELVSLKEKEDIISLILPRYELKLHGLETGLLLMEALFDWNKIEDYENLTKSLYTNSLPEEIEKIMFIESKLLRSTKETRDITGEENPHIDLLMVNKPLWGDNMDLETFPKEEKRAIITVVAGIYGTSSTEIEANNDLPERLSAVSKIYTLLVGEYLQLTVAAHTNAILPWIQNDRLGTIYVRSAFQTENPTGVMQPTEFEETFRSIREIEGDSLPAYSLNLIFGVDKEMGEKIDLYINLYREKNWILVKQIQIVLDQNRPFEKIDEVCKKVQGILKSLLGLRIKPALQFYRPKESPNLASHGEGILNLFRIQCYNNKSLIGKKLYDPLKSMEQATKRVLESKDKWLSKKVLEATILGIKKTRPEIVERFIANLQKSAYGRIKKI